MDSNHTYLSYRSNFSYTLMGACALAQGGPKNSHPLTRKPPPSRFPQDSNYNNLEIFRWGVNIVETKQWKKCARAMRNPLQTPTLRKKRGKPTYGRTKAQSRRRGNFRIDEDDGNHSEYRESVGGDDEDSARGENRMFLEA